MEQVKIDTAAATPVASPIGTLKEMTVAEKRERWAQLLERRPDYIRLVHRLEYMLPQERDAHRWLGSPMAAAFSDPVLRDAGLQNETVGEAMRFFAMDAAELHEFTCDCGGVISAKTMASRIRAMATTKDSPFLRAYRHLFGR